MAVHVSVCVCTQRPEVDARWPIPLSSTLCLNRAVSLSVELISLARLAEQ